MSDFTMTFSSKINANISFDHVIETGSRSLGDYNELINKPIANGILLKGNVEVTTSLSNIDIENILG